MPPGFAPSGGSVMRAVSFFGAAAGLAPGASGAFGRPAVGAGLSGAVGAAGLSGAVGAPGLAPRVGGFGGAPPLSGRGGGGALGRAPEGGGREGFGRPDGAAGGDGGLGAAVGSVAILVVSFFGLVGAAPPATSAGRPGRLMRTVSRFCGSGSPLEGRVMRIVSALAASSSEEAWGFSSAIRSGFISPAFFAVNRLVDNPAKTWTLDDSGPRVILDYCGLRFSDSGLPEFSKVRYICWK